MTHYLVTVYGSEMVRELWSEIEKHGKSMTAAQIYIRQLQKLFPDYEYKMRPVTEREVKEAMAA